MGRSGATESVAFAARLDAALSRLAIEPEHAGRLLVAFSGGIDSTLLLDALVRHRPSATILAVHFDHGLHPDSALWSRHCHAAAEDLGIEIVERRLELGVERVAGGQGSVEARARDARYATLAALAGPGDIVLTAHHADDQLETVLLRILRGTGVRGLAAIHAVAPLGRGRLVRPLLEFTRAEIEAEAHALKLEWLEDPSNRDTRFDRNFLRQECLPLLRERWPSAGRMANRLAAQMAEAAGLLDELAAADLGADADPARIPLALLEALPPAKQNNVLRHALGRLGLPLPDSTQIAELGRALGARSDAATLVRWPGAEARIYRRTLHLLPPRVPAAEVAGHIDTANPARVAEGELRLVPSDGYGIPDRWARQGLRIVARAGSERFRPRGHRHHKALKQWFQEQGIVPWMRARVPLIYFEDQLVAIADLALADDLPQSSSDAPFWTPQWSGHSPLR